MVLVLQRLGKGVLARHITSYDTVRDSGG